MGIPSGGERRRTTKKHLKPTNSNHKKHPIHPQTLPHDLVLEILSRVSFTDLFNAKLCCREFLEAAEDDYIFKKIKIFKFPVIPWCGSAQEIAFFQFCMEKGNPEVFYRKGMDEYFSNGNIDLGLKYLKTASDKFHIEATYAYGIILVCSGVPESTKLGLTLLNSLNSALFVKDSVEFPGKKRILECRKRTRAVVSSMWIRRRIVRRRVACYNERICRRRYRWESDHEIVDLMCCDGCRWDHEVKLFRRLLGGL